MQIEWWTLVLQAINFLVLVWLLWRFLYKPVKDVIARRKELAEHAFAEAEEKGEQAEATRRSLEDERAELARERQDLLKKIHEETEAERREILDAARAEADRMIEEARDAVAGEREQARAQMRDEIAGLAAELAAELLRKTAADVPSGPFLERIERRLDALPEEERERMRADLSGGAHLRVTTAGPLDDEERRRWTDRLDARLGQGDRIDFETDPDILGGAELHFPHAVLRFTWADQLERAKDLIGGYEDPR